MFERFKLLLLERVAFEFLLLEQVCVSILRIYLAFGHYAAQISDIVRSDRTSISFLHRQNGVIRGQISIQSFKLRLQGLASEFEV